MSVFDPVRENIRETKNRHFRSANFFPVKTAINIAKAPVFQTNTGETFGGERGIRITRFSFYPFLSGIIEALEPLKTKAFSMMDNTFVLSAHSRIRETIRENLWAVLEEIKQEK